MIFSLKIFQGDRKELPLFWRRVAGWAEFVVRVTTAWKRYAVYFDTAIDYRDATTPGTKNVGHGETGLRLRLTCGNMAMVLVNIPEDVPGISWDRAREWDLCRLAVIVAHALAARKTAKGSSADQQMMNVAVRERSRWTTAFLIKRAANEKR